MFDDDWDGFLEGLGGRVRARSSDATSIERLAADQRLADILAQRPSGRASTMPMDVRDLLDDLSQARAEVRSADLPSEFELGIEQITVLVQGEISKTRERMPQPPDEAEEMPEPSPAPATEIIVGKWPPDADEPDAEVVGKWPPE